MAFSSSNGYFFRMAAGTSLSVSSMDDTATFIRRLAAAVAAVPLHPVRPVAPENRCNESVGDRYPSGGEATGAGGTFNVAPTLAAFNLHTNRQPKSRVFFFFFFVSPHKNNVLFLNQTFGFDYVTLIIQRPKHSDLTTVFLQFPINISLNAAYFYHARNARATCLNFIRQRLTFDYTNNITNKQIEMIYNDYIMLATVEYITHNYLAKFKFSFLQVFICFCFSAESANSCSGTLINNIFGRALINTVRIHDGILCVLGCLLASKTIMCLVLFDLS